MRSRTRVAQVLRHGYSTRRSGNGFTLIEALVSIVLLTLLLSLILRTAAAGRVTLERIARSAEQVETARVGRHLLDHVSGSDAGAVPGPGSGEVSIRLPVGWAVGCGTGWAWDGLRMPEAGRDSAWVIDHAGGIHRRAVVGVGASDCPVAGPFHGRRIDVDPPVPDAVLMRVWEWGVIRLDDAVRYGRAGTPRQPLTAAVLDRSGSEVRLESGDLVGVIVVDSVRRWSRRWPAR